MGSLISCYAFALRSLEDLSLYLTCTVLICCIVITITLVLGLGIGLGYNYCVVNMMIPAHHEYRDSNPPYVQRSNDKAEMFKEILEAERYYERDSQKHLYQFHSTLDAITVPNNTKLNIENNKHPTRFTIKSVMTTTTTTENDNNDEVSQEKSTLNDPVLSKNTELDIEESKHPTRTTLKIVTTRSTKEFDNTDEILPVTLTEDTTIITNKITLDLEDNTDPTQTKDTTREFFNDIGVDGISYSESVTDSIMVKDINSEKEIRMSPLALLRFLANMRVENKNYTIKIIPT